MSRGSAVDAILDGMLAGRAVDEVTSEVALQRRLSSEELDGVLREVWGRLQERTGAQDLRLALHLERRRRVFEMALGTLDLGQAMKALQDMARLEGLYDRVVDGDNDELGDLALVPSMDEIDGVPVM